MIYARSPYIVHLNDSGLVRAQFKLYIYTGTKDTDKGTADYEFDMTAIGGTITFDIAPYIRDFLRDIVGPNSPGRFVWVTTEVAKDTGAGLGAFATWQATQLACYGYTEPEEGANYTDYTINDLEQEAGGIRFCGPITSAAAKPVAVQSGAWDDGLLLHWIAKEKDSTYVLPVFKDDADNGAVQVRYYNAFGGFPGGGTQIGSTTITATSIAESDDNMAYVSIPAAARSFAVFVGAVDVTNGNVYNVSGNCGEVTRVFFINRFGVLEEIQFVGRAVESYSSSKTDFKRSIVSGGTYSKWRRQQAVYNKIGGRSVTINSGHYPEGYNEQFKQLLMSESVWILPAGLSFSTADNFVPVNITNSELQYKYSRYEKLINYEMTFEYANDTTNTIF